MATSNEISSDNKLGRESLIVNIYLSIFNGNFGTAEMNQYSLFKFAHYQIFHYGCQYQSNIQNWDQIALMDLFCIQGCIT